MIMIFETVFLLSNIFLLTVSKADAYRSYDISDDLRVIVALEKEPIDIVCETEMPMAYCGFVHPTGKRYSFSGHSLENGRCNIKVESVSKKDAGFWKCHIGKRISGSGAELSQKILVRVAGPVASPVPNVTAIHGKEVTLSCVTTKERMPLRYCRFEPPYGSPFSIDIDINATKPLLGKYYYPQNMSLDRGDCAVTILKVEHEDAGEWTCGLGMDDGHEYTDGISLQVEGQYTMSTASATGIIFGAVAIVMCLVILGVYAWKKRQLLGTRSPERQSTEAVEIQELRRGSPASQRARIPIPELVVESPSEPASSPRMM